MKLNKDNLPEGQFIQSFRYASEIPRDRPQVCVLGRSNSGKSSFISSLMRNSSQVKVSSKPGSTITLNLFSWLHLYIVDLPGYGYAKRSHSQRELLSTMISEYLALEQPPIAGFLTIDCRRDLQEEEMYLSKAFKKSMVPLNLLMTKSDKLNQKERSKAKKRYQGEEANFHLCRFISNTTGDGLAEVFQYLKTLG